MDLFPAFIAVKALFLYNFNEPFISQYCIFLSTHLIVVHKPHQHLWGSEKAQECLGNGFLVFQKQNLSKSLVICCTCIFFLQCSAVLLDWAQNGGYLVWLLVRVYSRMHCCQNSGSKCGSEPAGMNTYFLCLIMIKTDIL